MYGTMYANKNQIQQKGNETINRNRAQIGMRSLEEVKLCGIIFMKQKTNMNFYFTSIFHNDFL